MARGRRRVGGLVRPGQGEARGNAVHARPEPAFGTLAFPPGRTSPPWHGEDGDDDDEARGGGGAPGADDAAAAAAFFPILALARSNSSSVGSPFTFFFFAFFFPPPPSPYFASRLPSRSSILPACLPWICAISADIPPSPSLDFLTPPSFARRLFVSFFVDDDFTWCFPPAFFRSAFLHLAYEACSAASPLPTAASITEANLPASSPGLLHRRYENTRFILPSCFSYRSSRSLDSSSLPRYLSSKAAMSSSVTLANTER
mmetsp:Transcript_8813/g.26591  ORF Transcript_8813/g.26591 Transcript_8813/m.26591 type:complete len:259 (+) Transcript_8813:62-838(+)